jgi:hypothetical protein
MSSLKDDISTAVGSVAKEWKQAKRKEERMSIQSFNREYYTPSHRLTIKQAAFQVMPQAIAKASGDGRYLANARQIMYAARPLVLKLTGGEIWKKSGYFTQQILKEYIERHGDDGRIVWDARGNLYEPHTGRKIALGGASVEDYMHQWTNGCIEIFEPQKSNQRIATIGPQHRYNGILFIEKEGFHEILEDAGIAQKYDLAIMSTKGIPTEAASKLVQSLETGVKIYVVHDFDLAGFIIVKTLKHGTRLNKGYTPVVDLGLRLDDVSDLQSEEVTYDRKKRNPREYLKGCGASEEEMNYLVTGKEYGRWVGKRVELNAMTSDQLITWLESKLERARAKKVVPGYKTLMDAYQRAVFLNSVDRVIENLVEELKSEEVKPLDDLEQRVKDILTQDRGKSWDDAIWELAEEQLENGSTRDA